MRTIPDRQHTLSEGLRRSLRTVPFKSCASPPRQMQALHVQTFSQNRTRELRNERLQSASEHCICTNRQLSRQNCPATTAQIQTQSTSSYSNHNQDNLCTLFPLSPSAKSAVPPRSLHCTICYPLQTTVQTSSHLPNTTVMDKMEV